MLFSFKKLLELAALPRTMPVQKVIDAINSIGFEVESSKYFGDVEGIKFGKVVETFKNPNGDKLTVCKIKFRDKERIIQTTATNVEIGHVVLAFVPGSRSGKVTFKARDLKQITSEGMLASLNEFGIDTFLVRNEHVEGISIFAVEDLDTDPIEYLGLQDYILDIHILSNRSDANNYYVMALELSAYFKSEMSWPLKQKKNTFNSKIEVENGKARSLVMVEAKNDFSITIPDQVLLAKSGFKSINDIVDLGNLTLIMTGQPTHAYQKTIENNFFSAQYFSGSLEVLGKKVVDLKQNLVIKTKKGVVSIAGVIGLEKNQVKTRVKDFILELGRFSSFDIRNTMKVSKVTNDSSIQSSKAIGIGTTQLAIQYLSQKLNSFSQAINIPQKKEVFIEYDVSQVSSLLGIDIKKSKHYKEAILSLVKLGFIFDDENQKVQVPFYRHDLLAQQDMNEEVARFFGYQNLKPIAPIMSMSLVQEWDDIKLVAQSQGYQEVTTYTLVDKQRAKINPLMFENTLNLLTYISQARETIRNSLVPSLLEVIEHNQKQKINNISIFEIGMVNDGTFVLGLASTVYSFDKLKQDIINVAKAPLEFVRATSKQLHNNLSALIFQNKKQIGWIGKIHPAISNVGAYFCEIKLPLQRQRVVVEQFNKKPLKSRDLTISLGLREDLASKLMEMNALKPYSLKVIDSFETSESKKVTIRFVGKENIVAQFDKKFNKN